MKGLLDKKGIEEVVASGVTTLQGYYDQIDKHGGDNDASLHLHHTEQGTTYIDD